MENNQQFMSIYKKYIELGYRPGYLQIAIANHCKVSQSLVRSWIRGESVRDCYIELLKTYKIEGK